MKYQILVTDSASTLEEEVNAALDEGWKLQGGVSVAAVVTHDSDNNEWTEYSYAQAVIFERSAD